MSISPVNKFNGKKYVLTAIFIICLITSINFAAKRDKISPTAPSNLKSEYVGETAVTISWDASTDNTGVKSYVIFKDNLMIGSTNLLTYTINDLTPGRIYSFFVKARDASGNTSLPSNVLSVKTLILTTPSPGQTSTPTMTPGIIPTLTSVLTPSPVITYTFTPGSTTTPALTASPYLTSTLTSSPTPASTPTLNLTNTPTSASTPSLTPSQTPTPTLTKTSAPTSTSTPTFTKTPTSASTPFLTPTQAPTPTSAQTSTQTPTQAKTPTPTPTLTLTSTPTPTLKPTSTPTPAQSPTSTSTPTQTPTPTPTPTPTSQIKTRVVGYYAAWSAYSGYTPDKIDAGKFSYINYAFANIGNDLKITMGYPDIDPGNFSRLNGLKKINPNLKTLISVGGWSWSGRFSDVALTDSSRKVFAESCGDFISKYGFDGIDIDWEYPVGGGMYSNIKRPEDKQNFTLLIQKIREVLDARGIVDGKKYILVFAGSAGSWYINNVELGNLQKYVDFGNIMTYDFHGTWDKYTDFNAPLYNNSDISPQYKGNVDYSVSNWLKNGFPASKLFMGIPFYGNKYNLVNNLNNGLYQTFSGGSSVSYANIAANYLNIPEKGYIRYFSTESMVPWLFNGSTFISYDDEESIFQKARYVKNKALGGAMVWEISQDPDKILLNALINGLK